MPNVGSALVIQTSRRRLEEHEFTIRSLSLLGLSCNPWIVARATRLETHRMIDACRPSGELNRTCEGDLIPGEGSDTCMFVSEDTTKCRAMIFVSLAGT